MNSVNYKVNTVNHNLKNANQNFKRLSRDQVVYLHPNITVLDPNQHSCSYDSSQIDGSLHVMPFFFRNSSLSTKQWVRH